MIESLELHNIKAFQAARVRLAPLTLLSGVNAVGKSTVLQALALLRQSAAAGLLEPGGGLLLNGDLVELGTGADLLHDDPTVDDAGDPFVEIALTGAGERAAWRAAYRSFEDRTADLLRLTDPVPSVPAYLSHDAFQYLRADRIVPAVTYPKSYEITVRRRSLGARGEHTANYLRVHGDSEVPALLRHPGAASASLLRSTEAWLQELCPGVNLETSDIAGADLVQLSYGFFGRAGLAAPTIRYRPTNVGFGLTYALPIVVSCLAAGRDGLVLLENPEAHLHPRGQSALARLCALAGASGAQVIVETHSDHVLNGVRLAVKDGAIGAGEVALHYFARRLETTPERPVPAVTIQTPTVGPDGMISAWPAGFFDEWDHALDRLLDGDPR